MPSRRLGALDSLGDDAAGAAIRLMIGDTAGDLLTDPEVQHFASRAENVFVVAADAALTIAGRCDARDDPACALRFRDLADALRQVAEVVGRPS